jgi:hypothetical protein
MRYMVGTGLIEYHDWAGDLCAPTRFQLNYINVLFNPYLDCRNINIYGLHYATTRQKIARNAYIPKWCHQFFEKKHLAAADRPPTRSGTLASNFRVGALRPQPRSRNSPGHPTAGG